MQRGTVFESWPPTLAPQLRLRRRTCQSALLQQCAHPSGELSIPVSLRSRQRHPAMYTVLSPCASGCRFLPSDLVRLALHMECVNVHVSCVRASVRAVYAGRVVPVDAELRRIRAATKPEPAMYRCWCGRPMSETGAFRIWFAFPPQQGA